MLKKQQQQTDNRINKLELEMISRLLSFNDEKVIEIMKPRRNVVAISSTDTLGPIILDELHKSGQVFFPVYSDKPTNIVGVIDLSAIRDKMESYPANKLMSKTICYVHEEEYLKGLLKAVVKTHQHMFVVVNDKGDYTGIITAKTVLDRLLGDDISDEFNQYEDKELVAKRFSFVENNQEDVTKDETEVLE
jgi:CBS domain containing-hemolysin-like protein